MNVHIENHKSTFKYQPNEKRNDTVNPLRDGQKIFVD